MWNWPDATDVDLGPNTAWQGTILAPRAVVHLGYQQVNGPIVAGALYGTGETHIHPPNPCLPDPTAVPAGTADPDADADAPPRRRRPSRRPRPRPSRRRPTTHTDA